MTSLQPIYISEMVQDRDVIQICGLSNSGSSDDLEVVRLLQAFSIFFSYSCAAVDFKSKHVAWCLSDSWEFCCILLLARLMGQYCFAPLSASSVVVCNARGRSAATGAGRVAGPAADTARRDSMVTSHYIGRHLTYIFI